LESTSKALADRILAAIIEHRDWPRDDLHELVQQALDRRAGTELEASRILFRDLVEKACDLFDPDATRVYAEIFSGVVAQALPGYSARNLVERYGRVRGIRRYQGDPKRVCVLSRVTLGADVVITSQMLEAATQRFPHAEILFLGPAKNLELFAADARIRPIEACYARSGSLRHRLAASESIRELIDEQETLVIDPDSRLTQLGIIPVCGEDHYLFFESRAYGDDSQQPLAALTADWIRRTLDVTSVQPFLKPVKCAASAAITISLGVGENMEKLATPQLEYQVVEKLVALGHEVLIDRGAGGEESNRVDSLLAALGHPPNLHLHQGSFAAFASYIMQSRLYFGYDSAGQHVAASSRIPLVTVFGGYAAERTFERWRPTGEGPIHVVKVDERSTHDAVERALTAITSAAEEAGLS
jgi:ADP-heptose:LPS heptosyltransferase